MGHEAAVLKSIAGPTMLLLAVDARGRVDGLLFELAVEQRYRNATATNIEAVYTFPVPSGATLLDLEVRLGDKLLIGVVVEKRTAEAQYEEAIDKGDTAIMLERVADGLYTLNLGNLMAGEEATIRYVYAQTLRFEHGSARLTVPTVIAPRYGNLADAGFQPHQVPANDLGVQYPLTLSIELHGPMAKGSVSSPSHPIAVTAIEGAIAITLARTASLDRDFLLTMEGLKSQSSAIVAKDGEGYVALASFCTAVPPSASELPMRLKLLIDCSGSMAGDSIAAAKRALHRILEGLQPADQFSLSVFGSNVVHVVDTLTAASASAIADVAARIRSIDATLGGTEMAKALRSVIQIGGADGAADILLISDGEIMAADSLVAEACGAWQRVFAVGIGSAPAEAVLRRLAEATAGACEFVAPKEDVEAGILRMFARLRAPRVERVDITWPLTPRWTTQLPRGLFGGETIHVYAGFDALPTGEVDIALRPYGDGASVTAAAALPPHCSDDPQLARMAALARIANADAATHLRLALDYRLLTDRTNFIVVHVRGEENKATQLPQLQKLAQMHAAGWGGVGSVVESRRTAYARSLEVRSLKCLVSADDLEDDIPFSTTQESVDTSVRTDSVAVSRSREPIPVPVDWASLLRVLDAQYTSSWLGKLPTTLKELARLGVHGDVMDQMTRAHMRGMKERVIVHAFLAALEPWAVAGGVSRQLLRALRHLLRDSDIRRALAWHIEGLIGKPASHDAHS
jgi:Ca-activated chloride channel family protein